MQNNLNYYLGFIHNSLIRFFINGVIATFINFLIFSLLLENFEYISKAYASFIASFFGITISYIGNRIFVFPNQRCSIIRQALSFYSLYIFLALLQSLIIYVICDLNDLNYKIGFVLGTLFQFILSYIINKTTIFKI